MAAFTVIGLDNVSRSLKRKAAKISNPALFYEQAVVHIDKWIQKNFTTQGKKAYPGTGWKPLAPQTILAREKGWGYYRKPTKKRNILMYDGWLKKSWHHTWNRKEGAVFQTDEEEGGAGYGIFHDQGEPVSSTKKNKQGVPQRKITPTEKMIMPDIMKLLKFWVRDILK